MTAYKLSHTRHPLPVRLLRKQRGFTLIELMVVLAIGLIILAVGAARGGNMFGRNDVTNEVANLSMLLTNVKNIRSTTGYGTVSTNLVPIMSANGEIPQTIGINGTVLTNVWGGSTTINSNGGGVVLQDNSIPQAACIKIVQLMSKTGMASSVQVNGGTVRTGEVEASDAMNDCSSTTGNFVAWKTAS